MTPKISGEGLRTDVDQRGWARTAEDINTNVDVAVAEDRTKLIEQLTALYVEVRGTWGEAFNTGVFEAIEVVKGHS